jgi:hypothetical protein
MKRRDTLTTVPARPVLRTKRCSRFAAGVAWGFVLVLWAQSSHAARWREVGPAEGAGSGRVYVDLDSIRLEGSYRIAQFLTIYPSAIENAHGVRMDRFTQKTGFDCAHGTFALISTVAYLNGRSIAESPENPDWKTALKAMPPGGKLSQRAYELTCKALPVQHPATDNPANSAATVVLPSGDAGSKGASSAPEVPHR